MFNNFLRCLASRAMIGIADRDNTAGIGDNSAEISDDAAGIVNIAVKVIIIIFPSLIKYYHIMFIIVVF